MANIAMNWEAYIVNKLYVDWQELRLSKSPNRFLLPWMNGLQIGTPKNLYIAANSVRSIYVVENADFEFGHYKMFTTNAVKAMMERFVPDVWDSDSLTVSVNEEWYYTLVIINNDWEVAYYSDWLQWENTVTREEYPNAKFFTIVLRYWVNGNVNNTAKATIENTGLIINK